MTPVEAVTVWVERWRALRAWGRPLEEARVVVLPHTGRGANGTAWPCAREIRVKAGHDIPDALDTVLHEYAHLAAPGGEHHGPRWRRIYSAAITEVTGIPLDAESWTYQDARSTGMHYVRAWWRQSGLEALWEVAR